MVEVNYSSLQKKYGGNYIARQGDKVILSAKTYDDLVNHIDQIVIDKKDLVIEYIEPVNIVCVY